MESLYDYLDFLFDEYIMTVDMMMIIEDVSRSTVLFQVMTPKTRLFF
jgi:hypothetical protein